MLYAFAFAYSVTQVKILRDTAKVSYHHHPTKPLTFLICRRYRNKGTRGDPFTIKKRRSRTNIHLTRVVNIWNSLHDQTVSASSLNCHKQRLDTQKEQSKLYTTK